MSADTKVVRWSQRDDFTLLPEHIREAETRDWCEANLKPLLALIPAEAQTYFGEDFGRSGDLTVIAPFFQTQGLVRRSAFVVELQSIPFKQQEQVLFYLVDRLPRFMGGAMDARGNGQYLAEVAMQKYGATRIQQIMLTEAWYRENMPPFKAAFEDGTLDGLPRDGDILADLRAFQVIKGVARLPDSRAAGEDGKKRHGDAGIALVLAHYASRELNKGPVNVRSRRRRQAARLTERY